MATAEVEGRGGTPLAAVLCDEVAVTPCDQVLVSSDVVFPVVVAVTPSLDAMTPLAADVVASDGRSEAPCGEAVTVGAAV